MEWLKELFWDNLMWYRDEIIVFLFIATLLVCLGAGSAYGFMRFQCRQTAMIVGTDYRFSLFAGCYLRDQNNQWLEKRFFLIAQALPIKNRKQF